RQDVIYLVIPTTAQQGTFSALVIVAFVLKTIDIIHLIIHQSNVDLFFIDWERSKGGTTNSVSVWRTYFIANEYAEIQTFRKNNVTLQLICVLFFLKVINLEQVAVAEPGVTLFPTSDYYKPTYNGILRVGIAFSMFLAVGRSPHGSADVNMKDMIMNLEKESQRLSRGRGLEPNKDQQKYIMNISTTFRSQFNDLIQFYRNRIAARQNKKGNEHESEIIMSSYQNLNDFLGAFIDH
ncbi:unnamed protein product, partial [Didymodactylos carnosus]